jgi:hypothetical protein
MSRINLCPRRKQRACACQPSASDRHRQTERDPQDSRVGAGLLKSPVDEVNSLLEDSRRIVIGVRDDLVLLVNDSPVARVHDNDVDVPAPDVDADRYASLGGEAIAVRAAPGGR